MERRGELQNYLQKLFSTHKKILVYKSKALQSFIQFGSRNELSISMMNGTSSIVLAGRGGDELASEGDEGGGGQQLLLTSLQETVLDNLGELQSFFRRLGGEEEGGESAKDSSAHGKKEAREEDSDCGSEGSVDSGFGEDDVRLDLHWSKGRDDSSTLDSFSIGTAPSSCSSSSSSSIGIEDSRCEPSSAWSLAAFVWELCKSEYWIFLIAIALLLLNNYNLFPDSSQ